MVVLPYCYFMRVQQFQLQWLWWVSLWNNLHCITSCFFLFLSLLIFYNEDITQVDKIRITNISITIHSKTFVLQADGPLNHTEQWCNDIVSVSVVIVAILIPVIVVLLWQSKMADLTWFFSSEKTLWLLNGSDTIIHLWNKTSTQEIYVLICCDFSVIIFSVILSIILKIFLLFQVCWILITVLAMQIFLFIR